MSKPNPITYIVKDITDARDSFSRWDSKDKMRFYIDIILFTSSASSSFVFPITLFLLRCILMYSDYKIGKDKYIYERFVSLCTCIVIVGIGMSILYLCDNVR